MKVVLEKSRGKLFQAGGAGNTVVQRWERGAYCFCKQRSFNRTWLLKSLFHSDIIHVFIMSVHDPCACGMNIWLCMCAVACLCERASAYVYASVCVCAVIWKEGKKNDRYLLLSCMWNCYYPKGFSPAGQCIWVPQRNDSISHRQQNLIKTKTVSTAYLFQFACPSPHFDCCCLEHKQEVHFRAPSRR